MRSLTIALLFAATTALAQRPAPAPPQVRSILVSGGTVHVGDGRTIDEGAVGFREGRIDYVGYAYGVKLAYDTVIDASGKHVYPGLILPDATLGLQEIDQVRATADADEMGDMGQRCVPFRPSQHRFTHHPTVRANRRAARAVVPQGGILSAPAASCNSTPGTGSRPRCATDDGIHLNWAPPSAAWAGGPNAARCSGRREERASKLRDLDRFFVQAKAYAQEPAPLEVDPRLDAMRGLVDSTKTLFVHADLVREIQEAVLFAKRHGVAARPRGWLRCLARGRSAAARPRRGRGAAPVHSLPLRDDDPVDLPYRLPAPLKEKACASGLSYAGEMERMGSRNLAFTAGTAAACWVGQGGRRFGHHPDAAAILGIRDPTEAWRRARAPRSSSAPGMRWTCAATSWRPPSSMAGPSRWTTTRSACTGCKERYRENGR